MPGRSGKLWWTCRKAMAWRYLMVTAANAGLAQHVFALDPGDGRPARDGAVFYFRVGMSPELMEDEEPGSSYAFAVAKPAWNGAIHITAVWKSRENMDMAERLARCEPVCHRAGKVVAIGFLDRASELDVRSGRVLGPRLRRDGPSRYIRCGKADDAYLSGCEANAYPWPYDDGLRDGLWRPVSDDGIPIIDVRRSRSGDTVSFKCPHCYSDHMHSADGVERGALSHRVAHCVNPHSPFNARGYHLRLEA